MHDSVNAEVQVYCCFR